MTEKNNNKKELTEERVREIAREEIQAYERKRQKERAKLKLLSPEMLNELPTTPRRI